MVLFIHGPVIQIAPATQNVLLIEHEDQRATFFAKQQVCRPTGQSMEQLLELMVTDTLNQKG